jgi:hypothetical protein
MARAYKLARTFWGSVKLGLEILVDSVRDLTGIHEEFS